MSTNNNEEGPRTDWSPNPMPGDPPGRTKADSPLILTLLLCTAGLLLIAIALT